MLNFPVTIFLTCASSTHGKNPNRWEREGGLPYGSIILSDDESTSSSSILAARRECPVFG